MNKCANCSHELSDHVDGWECTVSEGDDGGCVCTRFRKVGDKPYPLMKLPKYSDILKGVL